MKSNTTREQCTLRHCHRGAGSRTTAKQHAARPEIKTACARATRKSRSPDRNCHSETPQRWLRQATPLVANPVHYRPRHGAIAVSLVVSAEFQILQAALCPLSKATG